MNLTEHFTYEEATLSQEAIRSGKDNTPPDFVYLNIVGTAHQMEKVRALLGHPIVVTSWYRSPEVNKAIGGATKSHHMKGLAVDFICPGFGKPLDICKKISESDINYDQLIHEFGVWVHIGFDPSPRHQDLTARRGPDGATVYEYGHNEV